jgi:hypothetical protein
MFGIVAPTSILANNVRPANAFARARALLLALASREVGTTVA